VNSGFPSRTVAVQGWKVLHWHGAQVRLAHLAEAHQGFVGNKLIGVGQTGPSGGNTPRSHLRESATSANVHRDFTILCAIFHVLTTHVFWVIRNTKSGGGSIEHLRKTFFLDATGGDPVTGHLAKENKEWSGSSWQKSEPYAILRLLQLLLGFLT
jgi:hypothetical protein